MPTRATTCLLLVSVVVNLGLAVAVWVGWRQPKPVVRPVVSRPPAVTNILRPVRTNLVIQPRVLSWLDIESDDYPTYIRNLRAIGCPEPTIRDIIVADVNETFAQRRAHEVVTPAQQWWRSEADLDVVETAIEAKDRLESERRDLLTRLLGPDWDTSGGSIEVAGSNVTFDGPLLGNLSPTARHAVREIELRNRERQRAYLQGLRGENKAPDPAELARLRQQTRDELARVLNPAELEEFLLRYSSTAEGLRREFSGFEPTADEFRNVFRATDALDMELAKLAGATDAAGAKRREELEQRRAEVVREALPPERYSVYQLNQDPAFRRARDTAEDLGAEPETVLPLYTINRETELERQRVLNDRSLSPEEQSQLLAAIDQVRLDSLRKLLGEDRFRRLQAAGSR